jgi:RimJ/RimL family protein N-acetyltransferase
MQTAADIPRLTGPNGLLARWHPDLLSGSGRALATAEHHHTQVALAEHGGNAAIAERPFCHLLLQRGEKIAAFSAFSVDSAVVNLIADLGVVDPTQQGHGLMLRMARAVLFLAAALRVETVLSWATLSHLGAQRVAQRAGLSLWGLVPASEVVVGSDGKPRYTVEALYGASLVPKSRAHWPSPDRITPGLRDLARHIRAQAEAETLAALP